MNQMATATWSSPMSDLLEKSNKSKKSLGFSRNRGISMYKVSYFAESNPNYITPCAFIASATFRKPAMFAPATRLPSQPYSLAALEMLW